MHAGAHGRGQGPTHTHARSTTHTRAHRHTHARTQSRAPIGTRKWRLFLSFLIFDYYIVSFFFFLLLFLFLFLILFRCVLASLFEVVSVRPSVGTSVGPSLRAVDSSSGPQEKSDCGLRCSGFPWASSSLILQVAHNFRNRKCYLTRPSAIFKS